VWSHGPIYFIYLFIFAEKALKAEYAVTYAPVLHPWYWLLILCRDELVPRAETCMQVFVHVLISVLLTSPRVKKPPTFWQANQ
jgi:hypothetical protein